MEDVIQEEKVIVTVTNKGYIKRTPLTSIRAQKRGGKGKTGIVTREEDFVSQLFPVSTLTPVLFFSSKGIVYRLKAWKIPEGSNTSKGKALANIFPIKADASAFIGNIFARALPLDVLEPSGIFHAFNLYTIPLDEKNRTGVKVLTGNN